MNEKIVRPGRFQREFLVTAIRHYQPPWKRKKIPTVYSWDELIALAAQNNPPSKAILILEGEKIEMKLNRRGDKWTFSAMGTATA